MVTCAHLNLRAKVARCRCGKAIVPDPQAARDAIISGGVPLLLQSWKLDTFFRIFDATLFSMTDFQITDADLSRSKFEGKVALVTGKMTDNHRIP